jgi:DNA-binding NarL/FixJ family response regulator
MAPWASGSEEPEREEVPAREPRLHALIADHDGLARRMMQNALQDRGRVVAMTARDARETLELTRYYRPTLLLIDIALPRGGAVDLIPSVLAIVPEARILTLSATGGQDQEVLTALRVGALGHIDKDIEPEQLARLVTLAASGEAIVPRRLIRPLLELWREIPDRGWRPLRSTLTTREWQIVELLGEGASTARIAERLVLSPTTVYSHINSLLRKLGVHSRSEAVAAAQRLRQEEAAMGKPPPGNFFG